MYVMIHCLTNRSSEQDSKLHYVRVKQIWVPNNNKSAQEVQEPDLHYSFVYMQSYLHVFMVPCREREEHRIRKHISNSNDSSSLFQVKQDMDHGVLCNIYIHIYIIVKLTRD